jgi:hypothetical protein
MFIASKEHLPTLFIVHSLISTRMRLKKRSTQYNKFDTKVPIFVILEDLQNANHIIFCKPRKWEDIQDNQFLILNQQHTIVVAKVH